MMIRVIDATRLGREWPELPILVVTVVNVRLIYLPQNTFAPFLASA